MAEVIENSDHVIAVKEGKSQRVTLLNPEPRMDGKNRLIRGIVAESKPDPKDEALTLTRVYLLSDLTTQSHRSSPQYRIVQNVDKIQDATDDLQKIATPEEKKRWNDISWMDSQLTFIGEYDAASLPKFERTLNGLEAAGHFQQAFADAITQAAEISREQDTGKSALAMKYRQVANVIRSSIPQIIHD